MNASDFLSNSLLLDLEARTEKIYRIGAVLGDMTFERKGRFDPARALKELDAFAANAEFVLGHNLIDHDIPILYRAFPRLGILKKPIIDTLFLSPLAFPENPYHRLVKDYKLVKDSLNDPVADAKLAASVFGDQFESFRAMLAQGKEELLSFYRSCFESGAFGGGLCRQGHGAVFEGLGVAPLAFSSTSLNSCLQRLIADRACRSALLELALRLESDHRLRPALAYCVAWLQVSGSSSVLPPWVRHRFPEVVGILHGLRDIPCSDPECSYCRSVHDPLVQLKRWFGFSHFRSNPASPESPKSLQQEIVRFGLGDRPLLAILPTGGGKSLCYQLPALVRHFRRGALTVVITPLQALMKDQVDNLSQKTGAPSASALNGLLTMPERADVLERVRLGEVAILYVSPEQLRNKSFKKAVSQREIGCWVFDEAHCLSKWGHDFRPDYLYAGRFIRELAGAQNVPVPPVACFTATAKPDVKQEIIDFFLKELGQELEVFEGGIERENLHFEVRMVSRAEKFGCIHDILTERLNGSKGSAIVYTATRKAAEEAAQYLKLKGWAAAAFHAGLTAPEKRGVQEAFLKGDIRTICATNAFGMGIDKDDVRLVLHADIPGSLENYLQEAGRAGRDLEDARCVLLYDEQDIETQFRLEASSELSQRDIAQILRGLRRARKNAAGEVVLTSGELLRDEDVETTFDTDDRQADTKVKIAVSWLERAEFLRRNENDTRFFQGKPLVRNLDEAKEKISRLNLPEAQQRRWLAMLEALMNADPDEGINADELAELPELKAGLQGPRESGPPKKEESDTQRVLRTLYNMAEAGLIKEGLLLTAFVRSKGQNQSKAVLKKVCALEEAMLKLMQEFAPDAAEQGWLDLSLRRLNQRLIDSGHSDCNPQVLLALLRSLGMDGKGLPGARASIEFRHVHQDHYRVKLQRSWEDLKKTAKKRRDVAAVVLETILSKVPPEAESGGELLVDFSSDDLSKALRLNIGLAGKIKDPLAAIDRGLLFLHEQKVIILQQGLGVFRQAMTIRILPETAGRRYTKGDFEPLGWHYRERVFQIHVMNEYARLGMEKIRQALEMVLAYFSMDRAAFLKRYFQGRKEVIERATGQESYRRIVEALENPDQAGIVAAPEERNMLVLAGPGSGKTRVVVHRCAYLLCVKRVPASSILVLCFNKNAAVELRRRLLELVGPDAGGVLVQTYQGLALRLTGRSFADLAEKGVEASIDFDRIIPDATRLLRGESRVAGLEPDEVRERLLAGYRHILVDEYQDIDEPQYEFISAIAGRSEMDRDRKLTILAVGDDDQNIYTFRGANVAFIRRFKEDYRAEVHYLVENYRSSANILGASNSLIARNLDRMKTEQSIRINRSRSGEAPGGAFGERDPVGRGRVQIIEAADEPDQANALVAELKRVREIDPALDWCNFAVLSRTRGTLGPIRSLLEQHEIPVVWAVNKKKAPFLSRIREIAIFLEELKEHRHEILRASELKAMLLESGGGSFENPWYRLLAQIMDSLVDETGDAELSVGSAIDYIFETLAEERREALVGRGVFLGTVHGAKGREFSHVFIPDGDWYGQNGQGREEERRTFYVAMTRAMQGLCIFRRKDAKNPHIGLIDGNFLIERSAASPPPEGDGRCEERKGAGGGICSRALRYELLGMQDVHLDFAAKFHPENQIHKHLEALKPGSVLSAGIRGDRIELSDDRGNSVARLSRSASKEWLPKISKIQTIRVVGMLRREEKDSDPEFKKSCRSKKWEVPWVEILYTL